ncbi:MAG: AraC family transcriptional regulator [Clostridia bacterium]|nr:AraC family transcriptional regulator [Clostridia bacterium]
MQQKPIKEQVAFNNNEANMPVYIDCIYRRISKKTPDPIYHYHESIELLYCVEGELEVTLYSKSVILREGDFIYLAPNTPHATLSHSQTNEHICLKFLSSTIHVPSSRRMPPEDYYISLIDDHEYFQKNDSDSEYIRKLFFDAYKDFSHENYFKRLHLSASIMLLMSYVFSRAASFINEETLNSVPHVFLEVLDFIEKNYATITLEDAANFCSLSYSYFSRTFKSLFGISFSNYVIKKRIEKSLALISGSSLSLNDIALECGFANLSHFIKCFSEEKGMTPKKLRKIITKEKQ